jgi:hypothetical protein
MSTTPKPMKSLQMLKAAGIQAMGWRELDLVIECN